MSEVGKPSYVRRIMSTHEGSYVFIIDQTKKYPFITEWQLKEELCDMRYVI